MDTQYGLAEVMRGVFEGCNNLTLYGVENSHAHTFAVNNNIPFSFENKTLSISNSKITLAKGKSQTLTVSGTAASEKITWKTSNLDVARVNKKGKVTGKKAGKATITVLMKSGAKVTFQVTVKK